MSKFKDKNFKECLLSQHEDIFICPKCSTPMKAVTAKSLVCFHQHCFDISKQGYVNFLLHPTNTKYDKEMFAARKIISTSGFFEPLIARISAKMKDKLASTDHPIKVLDAGCGEGSHLSDIQQRLMDQSNWDLFGAGIDISKEGIRMACKGATKTIWCVADLAKCPFADKQFHCILNILSPSNYREFSRMLANDGIVIKVIPESDYLKELRDIFYEGSQKRDYSNEKTRDHFEKRFEVADMERVQYHAALDHTLVEPLLQMTPLSWGTTEERLNKARQLNLKQITVDFTVLIGKK